MAFFSWVAAEECSSSLDMGTRKDGIDSSLFDPKTLSGSSDSIANSGFLARVDRATLALLLMLLLTISPSQFKVERPEEVQSNLTCNCGTAVPELAKDKRQQ